MKRDSRNVFIAAVLFIGAIFLLSAYYYRTDAVKRVSEQTYHRLADSGAEQSVVLNAKINAQFAVLETFAKSINYKGGSSVKSDMTAFMRNLVLSSVFTHSSYIDRSGKGYLEYGTEIDASQSDYFKKAMAGNRSIEMQPATKQHPVCFIAAVPVFRGGEVVGVVTGSYDENTLKKLLESKSFSGQHASFICDSNGNIVLGSDSPTYMFAAGRPLAGIHNVFNGYWNDEASANRKSCDVAADFKALRSGSFTFAMNGHSRYVTYEPIGINDWLLVNGIPGDVVAGVVKENSATAYMLFTQLSQQQNMFRTLKNPYRSRT